MQTFLHYLFREWFRQVGEALLLAFLVTTFVFTTVGVVGNSMNPNLLWGERVFVPKYETWLVRFGLMQWRRGEVAIVKPPEGTPNAYARFPVLGFTFRAYFIKRIVALPGDEVSYSNGQLIINGKVVNERHITDKIQLELDNSSYYREYNYPQVCVKDGQIIAVGTQTYHELDIELLPNYLRPLLEMIVPPSKEVVERSQGNKYCYTGSIKLKPKYYLLFGDNRSPNGSEDGRTFGPVSVEQIAGRASAVWWPLNKIRRLSVPDGFR